MAGLRVVSFWPFQDITSFRRLSRPLADLSQQCRRAPGVVIADRDTMQYVSAMLGNRTVRAGRIRQHHQRQRQLQPYRPPLLLPDELRRLRLISRFC